MPKKAANIHNCLNINVLPPPIAEGKETLATVLPMTENPAQPEEKLSKHAIKLIRRLLTLADADNTEVSIQDREWLDSMLSGISAEEIARHSKKSSTSIRQHVNQALDYIALKIRGWEDQQKQLHEMGDQLKTLQAEVVNREEQIKELSRTIEALKTENGYLHSVINAYSEKEPKPSPELIKVEEKTRRILCSSLSLLGVPRTVAFQFATHNIHTALDIIRYTNRQLAELDGVSDDAITAVEQALDKYDLKLGADIRWISYKNDYYIYPRSDKQS